MAYVSWIPLALAAINTGVQIDQARNQPQNRYQTTGRGSGSPWEALAGSPLKAPGKSSSQPTEVKPVEKGPMDDLAGQLAKSGPAPSVQQQQAPLPTTKGNNTMMGPPAPSEDPVYQQQRNEAAYASMMEAVPQALALAAPLLGFGPEGNRSQYAAPVAGGQQGANAFSAPTKRPSLGEILNSIPRMR